MKKLFNYITFFLSLVSVNIAFAQKQTPPEGGKAKDFKLSEVKNISYPNGLKLTTVHYGDVPKSTITLIIKTGNAHEAPDQIWLANITGRMLREGTSSLNFAALSKKAAMMGGSLNVNVGLTQTTITGSVL
ncbi:MAG: insulinase family protein, partial [Flavisolibacter sp.]